MLRVVVRTTPQNEGGAGQQRVRETINSQEGKTITPKKNVAMHPTKWGKGDERGEENEGNDERGQRQSREKPKARREVESPNRHRLLLFLC